ncbi:MAG: outer membrane protein assembly factor BamA [Flavobacteriales bacterium CG_4_10_14_0_2_um_filter_32_8]|nr:MAG: outer membrane protein assembly factor BamA [Flavobacteriales bacterium CG_4_10_14_0_2_um_filter_32_8]
MILILLSPVLAKAQFSINSGLEDISYSNPKNYEIGGITISGTNYFNPITISAISGLAVGDNVMVPGDKITKAIKNLWDQKLFANVALSATKIEGDKIFLDIHIEELPRLSRFKFTGVKKSKQKDLREEIELIRGKVVTENLLINTRNKVRTYFVKKGFLDADVTITQEEDTSVANNVILIINVTIGNRVKIKDINFINNNSIKSGALRRTLKDTKRSRAYNIFTTSKYIPYTYQQEKPLIIEKYNEKGYRDAKIESDTVYRVNKKRVSIDITLNEGNQFYFRDIKWIGNTVHSTKELDRILDIKKGQIYNKKILDSRLFMNQNGRDVSSIYLDDGYLFFQVSPVEVSIENDSIDFEMRIYEGKQARINTVTIVGNDKTNDHVIMREIRTYPGELFSRSDIIRTQRELAQLGYFNPETMGVNPKPNQENGTVDIEYVVEEKPSDQIELSGGWGGGRIVGSLGVSFNNFSTRNFFKKGAWRPLPAGDGQKLALRAQSSGLGYQAYSLSFTEPWLGGRKPNSLSMSLSHTNYDNQGEGDAHQGIKTYGASIGIGRRLKFPDDFFTLYNEVSYQYYVMDNYNVLGFSDGFANNISFRHVLSRNSSGPSPIYPTTGSTTTLTLQHTLPYSWFRPTDTDYSVMTPQEKNLFVEYHKWKFQTSWFSQLTHGTRAFVLNTKAGFGYLGSFTKSLGTSPFERFYVGGDGLTGFNQFVEREVIALRGFGAGDLSPSSGATFVTKYTAELRYPFSLNPSATIYGLVFGEAGNSWDKFNKVNPFEVYKSAGVGIRIFMPMFGMLGLDWGYRFDDIPGRTDPNSHTEIHFSIGGSINGW